MKYITKLSSTKLAFATAVVIIISGCSSNGEVVEEQQEQQNQQASQIEMLNEKTDALEAKLQQQSELNMKTSQAVDELSGNQKELMELTNGQAGNYTIKEKDTLFNIAKEHAISLDALLELNPEINVTTILLIGQKINVR